MENRKPEFIINSVAPIRICDNGGRTDTWFAGYGRIFNIGVYPYAEVQKKVYRNHIEAGLPLPYLNTQISETPHSNRIIINAENYGERYIVTPEKHWDK